MLEKAFEVEFANATGFAGKREEYRQSLYGSNTIPYARVMGLITEQTINLNFRNDINLTNEATNRYRVARDDLKSFAKSQTSLLFNKIEESNGLTEEIIADDNCDKVLKDKNVQEYVTGKTQVKAK